MRRNLPGLLFAALAACAFLVAMPQRGKAQTYAYFTIPATASPTCLLASPAPPPAPAALPDYHRYADVLRREQRKLQCKQHHLGAASARSRADDRLRYIRYPFVA